MSDRVSSDSTLTRWPGLLELCLIVLLGPVTALANQQAIYAGNMWACGHESRDTLHVIPALALVLVVGVVWRSHHYWKLGGRDTTSSERVAARTRFLGALGMSIGVFSAFVILAQWLGIFMFAACARA